MSFAARARRLAEDAQIVVLERDEFVSFANCGLPYHLAGEIPQRRSLLLHTPESLAAALNLDVRTGHEVIASTPLRRPCTSASGPVVGSTPRATTRWFCPPARPRSFRRCPG
jgi:NADPH-dependent 2,4-dienoyl-CoA reductase/sulfur reductase-like enzyme